MISMVASSLNLTEAFLAIMRKHSFSLADEEEF